MSKQTFKISTAQTITNTKLEVHEMTWEQFTKRLKSPAKHHTRVSEVAELSKEQYSQLKDVGYFIPGLFKPSIRRRANLKFRSMVTLDADYCTVVDTPERLVKRIRKSLGCAAFAYTTASHTAEEPKIRIIIPLAINVKESTYEPLSRYIADEIGLDIFDTTTHQSSRVMFLPSVLADGEFGHAESEGDFLDPREFLADKEGWQDYRNWPRQWSEPPAHSPSLRAQDPLSKKGPVGDFCRAFSIPDVIERFDLPYEQVTHNRYRYAGSNGTAGAIYYEAESALYSWHDHDPARGRNNAWDLVRVHKFGNEEKGVDILKSKSQTRMVALVATLPEMRELAAKKAGF